MFRLIVPPLSICNVAMNYLLMADVDTTMNYLLTADVSLLLLWAETMDEGGGAAMFLRARREVGEERVEAGVGTVGARPTLA